MVAAEAANLALHAALLVRAFDPRGGEDRVEQIVRAHRDKPIGLHAPAAAQHLLHRRAQVVIANLAEHATEPIERQHVPLQERLLSLHRRGHRERRTRETRPHMEQVHPGPRAREVDLGLAPVNLRRAGRRVDLRHEHLTDHQPELAAALADVITDRRLRDLNPVLVEQPPPDPLRRVPLLTRRQLVGDQPLIDHLAILAQLRRRPRHRCPLRRRDRRLQRLPDRPTMHAMLRRQRPDRQPVPIPIPSDLLEQLHSGLHSWPPPIPRSMSAGSSASARTKWGQLRPSQWGQFRPSFSRLLRAASSCL